MRRLRIVDVAAILGIALGVFLCATMVFAVGKVLQQVFRF